MCVSDGGQAPGNEALGVLERVDLRRVWEKEDKDFTPWLAKEDNIALLGDAVGAQLDVEDQEVGIGRFKADIVCRDSADGSYVLVENQLERSDHTHLGQLLTYAAGLDAVTVVWIARAFTDEHRAALDWLNEVTSEGVRLFGIEVELWRIGTSLSAPHFNVVAKPNDWTKPAARQSRLSGLTAGQQLYREYWQEFGEVMRETGGLVKPRGPTSDNWLSHGIGRTGFELITTVSIKEGYIGVELVLRQEAQHHFSTLQREREQIDRELGSEQVEWLELPKSKQIRLRRSGFAVRDRAEWPQQHRWLHRNIDLFHRIFHARVKAIGVDRALA